MSKTGTYFCIAHFLAGERQFVGSAGDLPFSLFAPLRALQKSNVVTFSQKYHLRGLRCCLSLAASLC